MQPTSRQLECITDSYGQACALVAGAGSGKTATLTQRVVYALANPDISGVSHISQLLAITYTDKAAGELKARIKAELSRHDDPRLRQQALEVDGAWISTIHGMCARILKENAFELGVDPSPTLLAEDQASALMQQSIEHVLNHPSKRIGYARVAALFNEYRRAEVVDFLSELAGKASEHDAPTSELFVAQPPVDHIDAVDFVERMIDLYRAAAEDARTRKKPSSTLDAWLDGMHEAFAWVLGRTADACEDDLSADERAHLQAQAEQGALAVIGAFPAIDGRMKVLAQTCRLGEDEPLRSSCARLAQQEQCASSSSHLATLLDLLPQVLHVYGQQKAQAGVVDFNDLIRLAARALRDPQHASIRQRYNEQFGLVMVDEFQDTNLQQVDMVNLVAGGLNESGLSRKLCVVGDAQQSIYRFRSADLAVFEDFVGQVRDATARGGGKVVRMGRNFRSHTDVLSFVKEAFEKPFGSSFLQLVHGRDEQRVKPIQQFKGASGAAQPDGLPPRINLKVVQTGQGMAALGREAAATAIAQEFRALHDAGHGQGQMVVLLGSMTNAEVYARALQRQGLRCAITGGSVFKESREARMVRNLGLALCNMRDTEALVDVLSSDVFCLSAEDYMHLMPDYSIPGDGSPACVSDEFETAIEAVAAGDELCLPSCSPQLQSALRVLAHAAWCVGKQPLHQVVGQVLANAGWLTRMQEAGNAACVGNAMKALRMLKDVEEQKACTALSAARGFAARLNVAKEAPGVLSAQGDDFVRIMTIHASKGLQFPIVAVAETDPSHGNRGRLSILSHGRALYVSLDAGVSKDADKGSIVAKSGDIVGAGVKECTDEQLAGMLQGADPVSFAQALKELDKRGDAAELQRKLYVAYTRAEEALFVVLKHTSSGVAQGAPEAIRQAVAPQGFDMPGKEGGRSMAVYAVKTMFDIPEGEGEGVEPEHEWSVRVDCLRLGEVWDGSELASSEQADDGQAASFAVPTRLLDTAVPRTAYRAQWSQGITSASALKSVAGEVAHDASADAGGVHGPDDDPSERPAPANEKGTAFHAMAQWAAQAWEPGEPLRMPPRERLDAIAALHRLNSTQRTDTYCQLESWIASPVAERMTRAAHLHAEHPFWVQLGAPGASARPVVLQGFIDLLAYDEPGAGTAWVVDYKTGTALATDEQRRETYRIQALCYAYALLMQGFDDVRLSFVFVEQPDDDGQPIVVDYPAPDEEPYALEDVRGQLMALVCDARDLDAMELESDAADAFDPAGKEAE